MTLEEAKEEPSNFVGYPKCIDCGWKHGSPITLNCGCIAARQGEPAKFKTAFDRARYLQKFILEHPENQTP